MWTTRITTTGLALVFLLAGSNPAQAQGEESSPSIKLGSSRIGGPGLTKRERRVTEQWDEPEEYLTEETLPKKGSKKRIPSLFVLLMRYHDGQTWNDACEKVDMIIEEGGDEAIASHPRGKKMAGKSYFNCAKNAFIGGDFEKTEKLLTLSERYGGSTVRHERVREKILRETYRKKLSDGDVSGAIKIFNQAQSMREDEDERIWLGDTLAKKAWVAYETKNDMEVKELMERLETVAPMNTEYRRLKEKIESGETVLWDAAKLAFMVIAFVGLWQVFTKWREKKKISAFAGSDLEEF